jgi:hypothetical protein
MRFTRTIMAGAALLLLASAAPTSAAPLGPDNSVAAAVAAPALLPQNAPQNPPVQVEVKTSESTTTWYTDPVWIVVGGLALLIIIVLAVAAGRGESRSTTTVVR